MTPTDQELLLAYNKWRESFSGAKDYQLPGMFDAFKAGVSLFQQPICPYCGGNDKDAPCAHPSEGKPGCLRDARLSQSQARDASGLVEALRFYAKGGGMRFLEDGGLKAREAIAAYEAIPPTVAQSKSHE